MQKRIAESHFVVDAPQRRVWDLLGPALLNSPIGLEKLQVLDENHVHAEARLKFGFMVITTQLLVVFLELIEPTKMVVALNARALGGLVCLNQKIIFTLHPQSENKTEVKCESIAEGRNPLLFFIVAKKAQGVAKTTLTGIEQTLKRLA
jgi:carbon monoxide dehydrogenase subunit G